MAVNSGLNNSDFQWYALRDLKRANAKNRAWEVLTEKGFEVFTPMQWKLISKKRGGKNRVRVPVIYDLLFVRSDRESIDSEIQKIETLQHRFVKGCGGNPMVVSDLAMKKFIHAVTNAESVKYYLPSEITSALKGKYVQIIGGSLNGYEGLLLSIRGSKVKRLVVEIPNLITAGIEVDPEYIRVIENETK
ncbi:MAG: UpxY family transcription antiterminator [Muribaculaceae bacterium]|nr:UpxY family transcription antiterminator [Muribaculaceae bacterium]